MSKLEELKLAYAECSRQRNELLNKLKSQAQQEPVVFYRCNGCGHAYEQVHPTSCDCMEDGGFDRVEYYTSPAQRKPLTDEQQIAEALRVHGLTLVKTASGYAILKLGQIAAQGIKEDA